MCSQGKRSLQAQMGGCPTVRGYTASHRVNRVRPQCVFVVTFERRAYVDQGPNTTIGAEQDGITIKHAGIRMCRRMVVGQVRDGQVHVRSI
jgi:hypothetical protein